MVPRILAAIWLVALGCCDAGISQRINLLKLGSVSEGDAKARLDEELAGASSMHPQQRLRLIEDALRPMYASLPKNSEGTLEHLAVRYALHRFFNNRSGWFIRGLEPNSVAEPSSSAQGSEDREWIPAFLQEELEKRSAAGHGATLEQLAALAAALEDLVQREAAGRLEGVYEMHRLEKGTPLSERELTEAVTTYYISFLLAGNFSASSLFEVQKKKEIFRQRYTGWAEAEEWLAKLLAARVPVTSRHSGVAFENVLNTVNGIGERYYEFNDLECNDLKQTLRGMEGRKPGRVRLASFYNKGLYSHWRFTEKVDYLRSLGALDESDPQRPYVIIANYAMARPNCLDSSSIYAICCRNDCESLMGSLEAEIGAATASPERIAKLVSALPSASVQAPRNLSATLMARLTDVASHNGGEVPLHGRLFAQFMHHAFPLECPYPHERGTINPQTPDEWIRQTGQTEEQASTEEMIHHVHSDSCAVSFKGKIDCAGESDVLPWTDTEELLSSRRGEPVVYRRVAEATSEAVAERHRRSNAAVFVVLLVLAIVVIGLTNQRMRRCGSLVPHLKEDDDVSVTAMGRLLARLSWRLVIAVATVCAVAVWLELLDPVVVGLGSIMGLAILIVTSLSGTKQAPTKAKSVV